jgi:vanillate O-demethylase ferredoxin subunit
VPIGYIHIGFANVERLPRVVCGEAAQEHRSPKGGNLIDVIVSRKQQEASGIASYELVHADGAELPAFTAGAHIDVHLPGGLIRQYSLCSSSVERRRYLIGVLREPASRGGSAAMHDVVQQGDRLTISEPRNHFELVEGARRSLLIAGGIGITPLLAMGERLTQLKADFELHYCARSMDRMAFRERVLKSGFASRTHFHLDDGDDEQRLKPHAVLASAQPDTHLYVCGPTGFMDYIIAEAKGQGWRDEQIHREYFSADPAAAQGGDLFQIKIASTGQIFTVPEDKTVVEVLKGSGIEIIMSCEQGVCGTCLTRVLEGELEHRDMFMTDREHAEGKLFTPCCSRGRGLVVLDL